VHFLAHFFNDVPVGCHGDSDPTGWMKAKHFLKFGKHFVSRVKTLKERPAETITIHICQLLRWTTARITG
jgi:hypothetical protein